MCVCEGDYQHIFGEFMTKNRQMIVFVFLFAMMAIGMSSFIGNGLFIQAQEEVVVTKQIVYAHPYELFSDYSQWTASSYITDVWLQATSAGLLRRSAADDNNFVGDLADGKLADRGDENATTFRATLRDDAKHPSGNKITADDVVFSFMVSTDPTVVTTGAAATYQKYFGDTNTSNNAGAKGIPDFADHVKKVDDKTIDFNLRKPYAFTEQLIAGVSIMEEAVYGEGYTARTEDFNDASGADGNGAGPYKVTSIDLENSIIVLDFNEHSHRPNGDIGRIIFRFYSTAEAALSDFATGDVQIIDYHFAQKVDTITDAGAKAENVSHPGTQQLTYNHIHPVYGTGAMTPAGMADSTNTTVAYEAAKHVRQAISHIINRDSIVETILKGLGSQGVTQFTPSSQGYDDSLKYRAYDPEAARALMVKAGYNYSDLDLLDEEAEEVNKVYTDSFFKVHVYAPNSNLNRVQWGTQITENFKKIGIGFEYESVGFDILGPRTFSWKPSGASPGTEPIPLQANGGFDMYFIGLAWDINWDPGTLYDKDMYSPESGNFGNVRDDMLADLFKAYIEEPDVTKRNEAAKRLQAYMYDFEPESLIVYPHDVWGFDKSLSGYSPLLFSVTSQEWDLLRYDGDPITITVTRTSSSSADTATGGIPFYLDVAIVVFGLAGLLGLAVLLVKRRSLR